MVRSIIRREERSTGEAKTNYQREQYFIKYEIS